MRLPRPHAFALVALSIAAAATPAAALTKAIGPLVGYNFSTLKIDGRDNIEGRSTVALGGVLDLGFNERFGLRIEPTFLNQGAKATQRNAYWGSVDGAVFKLDYLNVPVLARYDLAASETRGFLLGGFGFGFSTSSKVELTQGTDEETVDFKDVINPIDITLDFGAGVLFPAGTNSVTIDGRVALGLMDINDGGTVTFQGAPLDVPSTSTKSLAFRIMASYLFKL